jgi:histone H3/H4
MPWSVCRMLFESRAEAYEASKKRKTTDTEDVRHATTEDVMNWI